MLKFLRHYPDICDIIQKHASETGYTPEVLKIGFQKMMSHWTSDEFEIFFRQEIPGFEMQNLAEILDLSTSIERRRQLINVPCAEKLLLVTASTVPSAAFQDVMLSLLLPICVSVRPSHHLVPIFQALHKLLSRTAPEFAARLTILDASRDESYLAAQIAAHDVLSVSGSDETIAIYEHLLNQMPVEKRPKYIRHGHKLSAICIFKAEVTDLNDQDIRALAWDASIWDQTGCLSPKCVFIESSPSEAEHFAENMTHWLDEVAQALPEDAVDSGQSAARNNALLMAELNDAIIFRASRNHDVCIIHPENSEISPLLFPRTLNIYPVENALLSAQSLAPAGQALCTKSALPPEDELVANRAGFHYFCRYGEMQNPPLSWFHDQIGTLNPLLKK